MVKMIKQTWRKELDNSIERYLSELITETKKYSYAIERAEDKSKAQLWIALALIYEKLHVLEISLSKSGKQLKKKEVETIIKKLEKL